MAANWHPSGSFEPLATCLFIGASYTSMACYLMDDRNVINIGLRIINRCGMYSKKYKIWIARENKSPPITETINSFKEYWAKTITLINQTAALTFQHGYNMAAMDDDASITSYSESLIRHHARINKDPGNHHGRYARSINKHPAILHGCRPTAPTQHLCPCTAAAHIQQSPQQMQRRRPQHRLCRWWQW